MTGVSGFDSLRAPTGFGAHPVYLMGTPDLAISYSSHELGLVSIEEGWRARMAQTKGSLLPNLRVDGKPDH
jgi:hypothetical protein